MSFAHIFRHPPELPVSAAIPELMSHAHGSHNLVIAAPPGSGKTTLVPVVFAAAATGGNRVIVVQPRRVAARAAARRIAQLLDESVGQHVGYRVRGDSKPGTAIEMVTPGVLLRLLQSDPELDGVGCVIIDEIHERDLETDIASAFLLDVQESLRPELRLVAMSATIALEKTAELFHAETLTIPGDIHPVTIHDVPGPVALTATRSGAVAVAHEFLDHIAKIVRQARSEQSGAILVFVPGVREITAVIERLGTLDIPVMALHGKLPPAEQDRVLDSPAERVIVTTAIAESSLTVPGVRVVVDSGLARQARVTDGMGGLVTVFASQAGMIQRAGRAGREGPGVAYRCITITRAEKYPLPDIRTAELTDVLLQSAAWGAPQMANLELLDPPQPENLQYATAKLRRLGLIDTDGRITARGRQVVQLPLGVELARALIDGSEMVGSEVAGVVVGYLAENPRTPGADLVAHLRYNQNTAEHKRIRKIISRHHLQCATPARNLPWEEAVGAVVGLAHPEWLARARGKNYLMANGRGATLPANSPLTGEEWLAIADLGRGQGRADAMIYAAVPISEDLARAVAPDIYREETVIDGDELRGYRVVCLGEIELSRKSVRISAAQLQEARQEQVRREGIAGLAWSEKAQALRERLAFLHHALGEPWPDVSDAALGEDVDAWLLPFVSVAGVDLLGALNALKPWEQAHQFDELAPERIATPLGHARVDYAHSRPRVRMRIQEAFGWEATPTIAGVAVTLELLSPAQRPLAITDDLASFWAGPYAGVRADMRGRYPKHPWPEDPAHAEPTRRAKKRK